MEPISSPPQSMFSRNLATAAIVVTVLHLAAEVLIPIALAILLTFLFAGPVRRLQAFGLGRVPAVLLVVLVVFAGTAGLALVAAGQVMDLASKLPEYKAQIVSKMGTLRHSGGKAFAKAGITLSEINDELAHESAGPPAAAAPTGAQPLPVRVVETTSPPWSILRAMIGPLVAPLGTVSVVAILMIFMLIEREDLRDRFFFLVGQGQLMVSTQALDDASQRVSRYLWMQTVINASVGLTIGVGLWLIGLPNAAIWGLVVALLRYVPYLGSVLSAAMPITLSLAVSSGWSQALMVAGLFLVVELLCANFFEPYLLGGSLGLSTVAVLLSALFWSWTWGAMGLILATPITACVVVLGRFVPQLEFLSVLLGDRQSLAPEAQVYQRLLAMNVEQASEVIDEWLKGKDVRGLYDNVLIPALSLSERDRHRGELSVAQQEFIFNSVKDVVGDLEDRAIEGEIPNTPLVGARAVLCLGARDQADELTSAMLAQLLVARGVPAHQLPVQASEAEMRELVAATNPVAVCISALPPLAALHARYLSKRIRKICPKVKIVVGLWNGPSADTKAHARLQETWIDTVVTSMAEGQASLSALAAPLDAVAGPPVALPADAPLAAKD